MALPGEADIRPDVYVGLDSARRDFSNPASPLPPLRGGRGEAGLEGLGVGDAIPVLKHGANTGFAGKDRKRPKTKMWVIVTASP
jgi:hypothetical protein